MKIIDLTFFVNKEYLTPQDMLEAQQSSYGYIPWLDKKKELILVKHWNRSSVKLLKNIPIYIFKAGSNRFSIPWDTLIFLIKQQPEILIIQGFGFPWQLRLVRTILPKKCKILLQHHGELPSGMPGLFWQRSFLRLADGYLFTSLGNTTAWIEQRIIRDISKCHRLLEGSVYLTPGDKEKSRKKLGIPEGIVFLWVGRLNENKDPVTVLKGFNGLLQSGTVAVLYMIYQTEELLSEVQLLISQHALLQSTVILVGKIQHANMADWYHAADIYLSGSHREGSGYALLEAMACGAVPVVTEIPSFVEITDRGIYGYLFEPGNSDELTIALKQALLNYRDDSKKVAAYFQSGLSFQKIATDLGNILDQMLSK